MNRKLGLCLVSAVAGVFAMGSAQAMSTAQITTRINDNLRVTLAGNTRPEAIAANDRGLVSDSTPIQHAEILLRRTSAQEKELDTLIAALHNPKSPQYHKWLTAAQFGKRFGADPSDVAKITSWLSSHGLSVEAVSTGKMMIAFSGNAGAVRGAFHTEIHNLSVGGAHHIANMSDPQIPAALSRAVAGIVSLNDFRPHSDLVPRGKPALTGTCGSYGACLAVMPADFATIYNLNPEFANGITGKGQTIVVIEDTGIGNGSTQTLSGADWTTFRKTAGLSGYTSGSFTQINPAPASGANDCANPGINSNEGEATLDAEWASASAPDAAIVMASCQDGVTFGGLIALQNLLDSANPPPIVSISYGECEPVNGSASNAMFNATYQQAVAEGTTVFVSSGDESATSCDANARMARHGISTSGFATTPYNVAVGGTDFGDTPADCVSSAFPACNKKYWATKNTAVFGSAKSYIPEVPWNDSCAGTVFATYASGSPVAYGKNGFCNSPEGARFLTTGSGSGGPSTCATGTPARFAVTGGSCAGWAKPAWQAGVFGNPADGVRDIPDVSLFAANGLWGHFYVFCDSNGGHCSPTQPNTWNGAGGTSFASPIFAGIMALIEQKTGARQGNANTVFYALAASEYGKKGSSKCNSTLGKKTASTCVFHDVTEGDFDVNCVGANNCYDPSGRVGVVSASNTAYQPAYPATAGWDYTTGLGTVNVTNLVNAWPK
ncbi:MAG: S53 family peptidase [Rhizomicrobium sp.]